ncbi:MAG: helix-turn-helix domain-containing protein [Candidatus Heimdallarchaeota archaeon]|nr:MAG: transcriptional regulator [Candidatus Gerdarchaeota archaeon]RLI71713.1 MAG: transcriptional regulator [Candidatus Gerdarchaeota archaeon]RLI72479.1 MAG: transcriptional regulator [Candidatus Heimdallarchaeota archaeon]
MAIEMDRPLWKQLLFSIIEDENQLAGTIKRVTQEFDFTLKELAERAGIPISTMYKMSSVEPDTRISTLRKLILYVKNEEEKGLFKENMIGLITSRDVLDEFGRIIEIDGEKVHIREYLANTIEEEIILGVRAKKEGVAAIVCGPVAANTLKRILDIPVIGIAFNRNSLIEAIKKAKPKI